MAVRDTKIKLYQQMVFEEENRKAEQKLEKLRAGNEEKLAARAKELELWKEEMVRRRITAANLRKQELISAQDQNNMEALLQKRQEIEEDLMAKIREKADLYVQTPAYRKSFEARLHSLLEGTEEREFYLQVREADRDLVEKIATETGRTIYTETLPEEKVGGFIMQDLQRSYAIENTVASRIDDHRYRITKALYDELEVDHE